MYFIDRKLISKYLDRRIDTIRIKNKSNIVTIKLIGRQPLVYNGKDWMQKEVSNRYCVYKPIGALKNMNTKKVSVYRKKKRKNKNKNKSKKRKKK